VFVWGWCRQEVVTWVSGQKREVMGWVEQADESAKDVERRDLQRASKAARHELERSVAATRALTDQGFNQVGSSSAYMREERAAHLLF
jgi:hypothetical protein